MNTLEVLFTPADFAALQGRDLSQAVCIVFDVLRATSTMVTALGNGAAGIIPVAEIPEALALRQQRPEVLLAGERNGVRIEASVTGSIGFDLGNSPREFTAQAVQGRTVVMTTTNGTRALRACGRARGVLAGSFLNLGATAAFVEGANPRELLLVCSGTHEEAAYEDVLGAGALSELVWERSAGGHIADSALMAVELFKLAKKNLLAALSTSCNGQRLLKIATLKADVSFCAQRDKFALVAELDREGVLRRRG